MTPETNQPDDIKVAPNEGGETRIVERTLEMPKRLTDPEATAMDEINKGVLILLKDDIKDIIKTLNAAAKLLKDHESQKARLAANIWLKKFGGENG